MAKGLEIAILAAGSTLLFTGSFVGFAKLKGTANHQIPVFGKLFHAPPPDEKQPEEIAEALPPPPKEPVLRSEHARVFDVFRLESPFSTAELEKLVDELKERQRQADELLEDLAREEKRLAEERAALDEQRASLTNLRTQLEDWEVELHAREVELGRGKSAAAEQASERLSSLANLFAEGDPEELSRRLLGYEPGEAARILRKLDEQRARELLAVLPPERWKEYAEAYSHGG